jgi:O-antigen biosynthesis protein WbqP
MSKRILDLALAIPSSLLLAPIALVIALLVKATSPGPALYWSDRVGRDETLFRMPKFRTMNVDTPAVATHLLLHANSALTPIGGFLRRTSLDEIPQLWCILTGEMSLVGPRPALFNQRDLIALRREFGVEKLRPGITGWAQINGRDELSIPTKVKFDKEYLQRRCIKFDLLIIARTASKIIGDGTVTH